MIQLSLSHPAVSALATALFETDDEQVSTKDVLAKTAQQLRAAAQALEQVALRLGTAKALLLDHEPEFYLDDLPNTVAIDLERNGFGRILSEEEAHEIEIDEIRTALAHPVLQ
jgi:hypothetical protein